MNTDLALGQATVGIVTALPKELAAVRAVFSPCKAVSGNSNTVYDLFEVPCVGGHVVVAASLLPGMGNSLAAAHASLMRADCTNLHTILMVGVAGAIPRPDNADAHVRLGDIVVSGTQGVLQFDFGKKLTGKSFECRSVPARPSALMTNALNRLLALECSGRRPWETCIEGLCESHPEWRRPLITTDILDDGAGLIAHPEDPNRRNGWPRLFVGMVASSNAVIKDARRRKKIVAKASRQGNLLCCVEMEGSGIQDSSWLSNVGYFVVRGTCDYCNAKKNKQWQPYAALVAAAFARSLVEVLPASAQASSGLSMPAGSSPPPVPSFGELSKVNHVTVLNIHAGTVIYNACGSTAATMGESLSSVSLSGASAEGASRSASTLSGPARQVTVYLERVRAAMAQWSYPQAMADAEHLRAQVAPNGGCLSDDLLLSVHLQLARLSLSLAELGEGDERTRHLSQANEHLVHAEGLIGSTSLDFLAEVAALRVAIQSFATGHEDASALLIGRRDAYAIRTRAALLLNRHQVTDAVAVIEGLAPHERWCDVAVTAYTLNDQIEKAQEMVQFAAGLSDRSRYLQCCVRFNEGIFVRVLQGHPESESIQPGCITESERERLLVALEGLRPVLDPIREAGRPASGLDMAALRVAWQANHLLQHREATSEILTLLLPWVPVPVEVARGVVSGYIKCPPDLPDRLRKDHPGNLDANIAAAVLDSCVFGKHKEAFEQAKALLPMAETEAKKVDCFKLCYPLWNCLKGEDAAECATLMLPLVAHDPRLSAFLAASLALRAGDTDEAARLLGEHKAEDDPQWLQLWANVHLQRKELAEAATCLHRAARITLDPDQLLQAAEVAYKAGKHGVAVWCYEKVAALQPDDIRVHSNLAHIYVFLLHDLENGAAQFRELRRLDPGNPVYTTNLAVCLARLYRPAESLALYEELCGRADPALNAVMGRAQLHHSIGGPEKALASLESFRGRFWNEAPFLMAYMSAAHAAGRDDLGHEALMALDALRKAGSVDTAVLRAVPKDEALEVFKQSFQQARELGAHLHSEMLKGRMPWTWAEQASNNALYWGWRTRTQEIGWIGDEPTNRAQYCVYATNGFHPRETKDGKRALLPLACPPKGTTVVADVSALITLHRLGLLDAAAEYFGEVLVPAGYLPTVLEDSRKMVLHQRSRQQTAEQIAKQVNAGRIAVLPDGTEALPGAALVDEYAEAGEHRYRLVDLVQPLYAAGILDDGRHANALRVCGQPSAVDEAHSALERFRELLVDLTTLETIAQFDMLDAAAGFYRIAIPANAHRKDTQRLDAIAYQEETRQWHMDLWTHLRGDPRFRFVPHVVPEEILANAGSRADGDDGAAKAHLPFLACFIADGKRIPLLADDRVCQAFTLNEMDGIPHAAFGSDALAVALMAEGKLDAAKAAGAFRQLMAWRYRFLIPRPKTLKALADLHRGNPPGQALREVAEYVHDCMRDPGLFSGPEKTDLGDSMAMRAYLRWMSTIAEFLVLVWADESYAPESATRLTTWTCGELLPSCPWVVDGRMKARVGAMTARVFLSQALVNMTSHVGEPRMADAMKAMKDALRLTDEEYHRIVTDALNVTARTDSDA